ncbi:Anaerobic dehydrogenases, typically selenocysteine-containing [Georgfuchsia toluolica]|uniref:Anaerobic dehydrogenases, typically selenocysteine-containing n=1 Tax=Georgfuchsia toluolica TaxID=424218 RepID=A0A916N1N4_9PROT|nr:DUF1302 family protein [Georgfuchsia toluolica]CAG4885130.1 Anaerobic dehydrogenases, typically selenocysteine-containing [Georgfuchsia toluolica]
MKMLAGGRSYRAVMTMATVVSACWWAGTAQAYKFDTDPDWAVNFDNNIQYSVGWRTKDVDSKAGNMLGSSQGDYKFPKKGDMITNRISDFIEVQGVYKKDMGFRVTGSIWQDFAYSDEAKINPALAAMNAYPSGRFSTYTKRFYIKGSEFLDYFGFLNTKVGESQTPVQLKVGSLSQYWGNSFFFPFTNIAYSQHPIDFVKSFAQPGSEVKELFLPRRQILLSTQLTPELSLTGQYFLEFKPNRYPEGGTYFGFVDMLFSGPPGTGPLAFISPINDNLIKPKDNNGNYGIKVGWSPEWANADMGFYYRQFDDTDPWLLSVSPSTGHIQNTFAQKAKLVGFSLEKSFGLISTGLEISKRIGTALNSNVVGVPTNVGATGDLTNVIANTFIQLGKTPLWDAGILLAEISFTHLNQVTHNAQFYKGVGYAGCPAGGSWKDGCSTKNTTAFAMLFSPQWLQVFPGVDLSMPFNLQAGIKGVGAHSTGTFFPEGEVITSLGIKANYLSVHSVSLTYSHYHWRPKGTGDNGLGAGMQAYTGGAGPVMLNDRDWLQLQFKTSF